MENWKAHLVKVSPAVDVGDCWVCGMGRWGCWLKRRLGLYKPHDYDPIREDSFRERERLDRKYRGEA